MNSAQWLSSAAFCISVTALLSNLGVLWLKWPRIIVEVAVRSGVAPETAGCDAANVVLTVVNNGSEAVTIKSVGLTSPAGPDGRRLDYLDTWHTSQTPSLPRVHGAQQSVVMPVRIDGHASVVFEYACDALTQLPPGRAYRGYAKRYRAWRWRPNHPLLRETLSRHSVTPHVGGARRS